MNILYIDHYAGSPRHGMEFRPYYLAREWLATGHKVRVLASSQSHIRTRQPELNGADRLDEKVEGVDYTWFAGPGYAGNGIGRIRNMLSFLRRLYVEGRSLAEQFKPDLVIASSTYPMDIWPARRIAKLAGAKLVFEVHDLWPLSPMELGGMSRWHPFIMWVQLAEDYAYRHADIVVSILPNVHEHMASRGLDLRKLVYVPNGVAPAAWLGETPNLPEVVSRKLSEIRSSGRAIVGYLGGHGLSNALDEMLRVADAMRGDPVTFVLVGSGPDKPRLVAEANRQGLDHVVFLDSIDKDCVPAMLKWFDIGYIAWQASPLYRFGVSANKLFDYMMAGRVVVQSIGVSVNPIEQSGCGICEAPGDIKAQVDTIRRLLAMSLEEREEMGEKGRRFVIENHLYPVLAKRFLDGLFPASRKPIT